MDQPSADLAAAAMPRLAGPLAMATFYRFARDPVGTIARLHRTYGALVALKRPVFWREERLDVFALGPAYNRRVLGEPKLFRSGGLVLRGPAGSAQRRLRYGLVAMNGDKHKYWRSLLLQPLRRPNIDGMIPRITAIVDEELDSWPAGRRTDLWPLCKRLMQRVSLHMLFNAGGPIGEGEQVAEMINAHVRQTASPGVLACPVAVPGTPYHGMLRHSDETERQLLHWARQARGKRHATDLLSIVVNRPDYRRPFPEDHVVTGHIPTLFGASYETCQTALAWTLFLLAQHPEANAELLDALDAGTGVPPDDDMLEWVINEGMRLLPPVPYQIRVAKEDTDLVGQPIRRGTRIYLAAFLTNRNPEIYEQPEQFRPRRWATINPSPYEYLTFSAGPRTCIGFWFAMTVLRIAVAAIVRRYRISLVPGTRIDRIVSITMSPRHGMEVDLQPQDRQFRAAPVRGDILDLVGA